MKKEKVKKIVIISIVILVFLSLVFALLKLQKHTTLIQFAPQSSTQMMGYLIKTNNGKIILIDGGTVLDANHLEETIQNNGGKVDYWFLTHAHHDHVGAFTEIVSKTNIQIENVYVSINELAWYEKNEPARLEFTKTFLDTLNLGKIKDKVKEPKINEKIEIDNIEIEILGIKNPEITENSGNEQSMVFTINTGKTKLLVLGDTGEKSSEKLLKTQKEKLKSDIVQMAHHGQQGATKELYKVVNPKICLWPTPEWLWNNDIGEGINSGPWKTFETIEWMKESNINKHYIAKDGDITIKLK